MIVRLSHDPEIHDHEQLRALLAPLYGSASAIVDLRAVEHLTSRTLSAIAALQKHRIQRKRSGVRIVYGSQYVRTYLTLAEFDRVFDVFESLDAALTGR